MQVASGSSPTQLRRAVLISVIGQVLEWYDFFLYGTAAALVFGTLFFPLGKDPLVNTIAAFGGFTVGFIARPIGGILCGHFGDVYGRKPVMLTTLLVMGAATATMGLLPTYKQIGIAAPILLMVLRVLQGLAAGGEWNGSILLIYESAPKSRRGALSAWSPSGASLGFVLSTAVFLAVQRLPPDALMSWGWRIPFLLSLVLVVVGIVLRSSIPETLKKPALEAESHTKARVPLVQVLRDYPKRVLTIFGLRIGEGGASFIFFSFSIAYGRYVGISTSLLLLGLAASMLLLVPVALLSGYATDHFGRKPVYVTGAVLIVAYAAPFFLLLQPARPWLVILDLLIANGLILGILEGAQPAFICELLPKSLRFTGLGVGREIASVLGGGLSPVIGTALLLRYHRAGPIALYLAGLGLITAISAITAPETFPRSERILSTESVSA